LAWLVFHSCYFTHSYPELGMVTERLCYFLIDS
jgi:hypothetical protein